MTHTADCLKAQAAHQERLAAFVAKHPHYCRACGGAGGQTVYDTVDYGSTTAQLPSWDTCAECVGNGKCPLCGEPLAETDWEGDGPCPSCGWVDDGDGDTEPQFECECWLTPDVWPQARDTEVER